MGLLGTGGWDEGGVLLGYRGLGRLTFSPGFDTPARIGLQPVTAAADPARRIAVIGAALDLGSGRRGVDMGPSAIRYAQLSEQVSALGYSIDDHGNVDTRLAEALDEGDPKARYWDAIKSTCEQLAREVGRAVEAGELPLVLGGDHAIAVGSLGGLARGPRRARRRDLVRRPHRYEHAADLARAATSTACRLRSRSA